MKVFTFEKSFQQRIDEFSLVLDENDSGSIRDQWKDFLETSIEPAGYKAIWKISKGMCEMYNISFPSEVYGEVQNTNFEDLTADFLIELVRDERTQLPELCEAPIEDIYPTHTQPNNCLNVAETADFFDRYRFFYNYIFLPFDADDKKWTTKNLESRIKLFYDLKNKNLSKGMSSYIRQIIAEVKYIQFKTDVLTNSVEDEESMGDDMKESSKETIAKLLDFHLRMNKIKHEIEILVNSEMREAYESVKFGPKLECNKQTFVISKNGTINDQMKLLEKLKNKVSSDTAITWMRNLCDAISCSTASTEIYIPQGCYPFNFLDYLNNNLLFCGVEKLPYGLNHIDNDGNNYSTLYSVDKASMLFVVDGDMKLENLIIDCRNVRTGFFIKSGSIILKNCLIIGLDSKDSTVSEGFNITGESSVIFDTCIIRNFATAFNLCEISKIELSNSKIENCNLGINILDDNAKVCLKDSSINDFMTHAILKYSENVDKDFQQILDVNNQVDLERFNIKISGDTKFIGETKNVIKIMSKLAESETIELSDNEDMET